jgi:hypothetical protein
MTHIVTCSTVNSIAGSSNGRTAAFEAVNLGSNPSPAACFLKENALTERVSVSE